MSKFTPLPHNISKTLSEESSFMIKPCSRFNSFYQGWGDNNVGVIYLKLRSKSCGKLAARTFCSRPLCRVDSTRVFDGPAKQRILKVKGNPALTINVYYI